MAKVTAERVELIPAGPIALAKGNHPKERADCILPAGYSMGMDISQTWFPPALETATTGRMKYEQYPAEVILLYWVPPVSVYSLVERPEATKRYLDDLACYDVSNNRDAGISAATDQSDWKEGHLSNK